MRNALIILLFSFAMASCMKDDYDSPHLSDPSLLPNRADYLTDNYGTRELAREIYEAYLDYQDDSVSIKMMMYDNKTRTQPLLTFTESKWPIRTQWLANGSLDFGFRKFQTEMMPLKMTTNINMLLQLNSTKDTIFLRGRDGRVRTEATSEQPIGTPLPQSDDAELEGYYVRKSKKLYVLFDLMLPIAMKAHITGTK
ncbi:hypothetical protein [Sphingobacterium sp.]|uniref:hypothetical protein n=1 Tax=Sphingobacterium sp. TaxID=341027 RepID=UPI0028A2A541|nr:hypothetical protein [Sphingobacterium sp.]